ncbi:MAG: glycosyltransferase, partial [Paludibacter sp.]|nr:glycosyltransferase [Paludibacter sp.]
PSLIKAFHKAVLSKARLIIAGAGAEKEVCLKLVEELNQKQIDFISVSPESVPVVQLEADVLLLSLKKNIAYTATPSKLTAYLLSAKAVLACVEADTDPAEIISTASCGLVANPEDTDSIANLMQLFYRMPTAEIRQMGVRARTYALQYMTKDVNLSKLSKEIEKLTV